MIVWAIMALAWIVGIPLHHQLVTKMLKHAGFAPRRVLWNSMFWPISTLLSPVYVLYIVIRKPPNLTMGKIYKAAEKTMTEDEEGT